MARNITEEQDRRFGDRMMSLEERGDPGLTRGETNDGTQEAKDYADNPESSTKDQPSSAVEKVRSAENKAPEKTAPWIDNTSGSGAPKRPAIAKFGKLRKFGPIAGVASVLVGGAMFALLGPMMAPFAFMESTLADLEDHATALTERSRIITRHRINTALDSPAISRGCGNIISVRCKLATVNDGEINRLRQAGFDVEGTKGAFGRTKIQSLSFAGTKVSTGEEFRQAVKTNARFRNASIAANNIRNMSYWSPSFMKNVLGRFGKSKLAPGLSGSKQDRLNQLLTATGTDDPSRIRMAEILDDDGNPTGEYQLVDADGNPLVDANGNPYEENKYTSEQHNDIERLKADAAKTPSAIKINTLQALSVLGYWDMACSINFGIKALQAGVKVVSNIQLAGYALDILAIVDKMKTGDATPEEVETLGQLLTDADTREQVLDVTKSLLGDGDVSIESEKYTPEAEVYKPNPTYNQSAMDSRLQNMSANGGVAGQTEYTSMFKLGVGYESLFGAVEMTSDVLNTIVNLGLGDNSVCGIIQNPLTRLLGVGVSIALGVGTSGVSAAVQVGVMAGMLIGVTIVNSMLTNILAGNVLEPLLDLNNTVARGEAWWTGMASVQSATAQNYGMAPARSVDELIAYQKERDVINSEYIAMEAERANPLDIKNQYSVLGSITRTFFNKVGYTPRFTSILSMPSVIGGIVASPGVSAMGDDPARYNQCDDEAYTKHSIVADVQCNVRFAISRADLNLNPDLVAKWMEDNGYVEQDTSTGLPEGYTPPDMRSDTDKLVTSIIDVSPLGNYFDGRNLHNEYAKFLEACVYRSIPYGEATEETGLIGGLSEDWQTGKLCSEPGEPYNYFRVYTLDQRAVEAQDTVVSEANAPSGSNMHFATTGIYVSPIPEDAKGAYISSGFEVPRYGGKHDGIDIAGFRDDILSACDGVVNEIKLAETGQNSNAGGVIGPGLTNYVYVKCDGGERMGYAHMFANEIYPYIQVGQRISAGTPIAPVGNQGSSSNYHLHYNINIGGTWNGLEYKTGRYTNPVTHLREKGVASVP